MEKATTFSPAESETVDLSSPFQKEFYNSKNFRHEKKLIRKAVKANKPEGYYSKPLSVVFKFKTEESSALLEISETADFSQPLKVNAENGRAEVYNLKKSTRYFWKVDCGEVHSFFTDGVMPRWIFADGCHNIRDFGGEKNTDGETIRQNMVFRGPRLENESSVKGIGTLKSLGIKTDLDLRKEISDKLTASPLGENVKFILHPCTGYEEFLAEEPESIKKLIEYFTDETIYPVYFHCHGGQDRTGALAFMLGAILGLDDETLIRDYELTMLSFPDKKLSRGRKGKIKKFLKIMKNKNRSKSIGENAVDFLLDCGVTHEDMNRIREILLEK